ncbi:hypothetical protein [Blastomonas marina]|uniref:hypothetical protein n=1 Tax=Blastomonas marina TaxID=1867408 RepID=UPI00166B0153|nr:hypothetical protein [Blastomonas marina]
MPRSPAHRARRKPPFFRPVPLRQRRDGWSEVRQCAFLAELYLTGSVTAAARRVGMSRMSAYRLRRRAGAESFACAWDHIFALPGMGKMARPKTDWRKVTNPTLMERVETGLVQPVLYAGKLTAIRRRPDNSALLRVLRRHDALCEAVARGSANR